MKNNQNELSSGNDSINVQGRDNVTVNQTNNYGVSVGEARQIAMDIFKSNFYDLSQTASEIALKRAEELVNSFLEKLEKETPELIVKIEEPDVQYTLINAQKHYARSGQPENLELLTNMLKYRFQAKEGTLKGIVLNEAIEVMSKLTIIQMKFITALFLVKNCKLAKARYMIENLDKILTDDTKSFQKDISLFEHLIFAGVAANDITVLGSHNLEYHIRDQYFDELDQKVEGTTLDVLDPPVRKQFITDELSESVFDKWNNSNVNRYSLTSVGKAIAVAYYNAITGANVDLGIWVKS